MNTPYLHNPQKTGLLARLAVAGTICLVSAVAVPSVLAQPGEARSTQAVFQYALPVETKKGERMAFLWIPPEAKSLDGIVVGGMTLMEREMSTDAQIRKACAEENLAILFFKCGLRAVDLQAVLDGFAELSGYGELSRAPMLFVGHSAGGPQAKERARDLAARCIGLVQYRGADPGGDEPVPAGVPTLMMIGQFDEFGKIGRDAAGVENWEKDRDKMVAYREADPGNLSNVLVEPGGGHFAWSDRNAEFLSLFIRKAAKARIPDGWALRAGGQCVLNAVLPESGWLTDPAIKPVGEHKPAPYAEYTGEKSGAAWHFDRELALATVDYHKGIELDDQFIRWEDPHNVSAGARNFFKELEWQEDGVNFSVHPVYAESYPGQFGGRGSVWGKAGEPVGNAGTPILVKHVSGPIVRTGDVTFRLKFDALAPADEAARVTFKAFSEGDEKYRYTERVGMLGNELTSVTEGKEQNITFPPIGKIEVDKGGVSLRAESDSGLPVEYYVAYGPAAVEDGKLVVRDLPLRVKFPVEIKVVAWQFGRAVEPKVQTAEPKSQVVVLKAP